MIIVCNGLYKSASTFCFQIAESQIDRAVHNQQRIAASLPTELKRESHFYGILDEELANDLARAIGGEPFVIKSHCPMQEHHVDMIKKGKLKCIVTFRDPRDAALACYAKGRHEASMPDGRQQLTQLDSMQKAVDFIRRHYRYMREWIISGNCLPVDFDELTNEPHDAARKIAAFLEVDYSADPIDGMVADPPSKIGEFFGGQKSRWKTELNAEQQAWISEDLAFFIAFYNEYKAK